jgi:predicted membrane protein
MKTKNNRISSSALFWALLFIGIAVVLLLDALQLTDTLLPAGLSIWRILLGGVFLWWLIHGLSKLSPFAIIFSLFGELMLFDRWLLRAVGSARVQIAPVWLMLLIALLLSIGFSILKHTLRPGHSNFTHADGEQIAEFVTSKTRGKFSGSSTQYFDCSEPFHSSVENNLGATNVFFSNTERYCGGSSLRVENNLGSLTLHVPEDWLVTAAIDNSLGSTNVPPSPLANPEKNLVLRGENNLGSITVKYVKATQQTE